jgi:hypothetical protein
MGLIIFLGALYLGFIFLRGIMATIFLGGVWVIQQLFKSSEPKIIEETINSRFQTILVKKCVGDHYNERY